VLVQECPQSVCPDGQLEPQTPSAHTPLHTTPQPPQFALSDCVLTHDWPASPPQSAWPLGQTHAPLEHRSLPVQAFPHLPQFSLSDTVFVHTAPASPLPQSMLPPGHVVVQLPLMHAAPDAHAVPHAPQLAESVFVLTQADPHSARPDAHDDAHRPFTQAVSWGQTLPQKPQFSLSDVVFLHVAASCPRTGASVLTGASAFPPPSCPVTGITMPESLNIRLGLDPPLQPASANMNPKNQRMRMTDLESAENGVRAC